VPSSESLPDILEHAKLLGCNLNHLFRVFLSVLSALASVKVDAAVMLQATYVPTANSLADCHHMCTIVVQASLGTFGVQEVLNV